MAKNKFVEDLMSTPMDRKQFLQRVGVAAVGVLGANAVFSMLMEHHPELKKAKKNLAESSQGFGSGKYGG